MSTFAIPNEKNGSPNAEIAQLVEHNLAKVRVASSSLVFRSKKSAEMLTYFLKISPDGVPLYVSRPCAQGRLFCFYTQLTEPQIFKTTRVGKSSDPYGINMLCIRNLNNKSLVKVPASCGDMRYQVIHNKEVHATLRCYSTYPVQP